MDWFADFAGTLVGLVWGMPMAIILTACGVIFTVMTMFGRKLSLRSLTDLIQLKALTHGFQVVRGKYDDPDDHGNISHFQALCTALSATIGLGNISGVAVAVAAGGAGAVFWMWAIGFLGMATKFMTCSLATMYREEDSSGTYRGGPMYYIEIGLGKKWKPLALLFALLGTLASLGAGNMFQSNQVADIFTKLFQNQSAEGLSSATQHGIHFGVGVVLFVLAIIVIIGGIKRIGAVASKVVPTMCVVYVLGALYVILMNASEVPALLGSIFTEAFTGASVKGAFFGVAVREAVKLGVKRACFSNEAGLGSAPIAHSAAKTNEPIREGVVAAVGPFIDTIVICTMTALVILITQSHLRPALANMTAEPPTRVTETDDEGEESHYLEFSIALNDAEAVRRGTGVMVAHTEEARRAHLEETNEALGAKTTGKIHRVDGSTAFVRCDLPDDPAEWDKFQEEQQPVLTAGNPVYRDVAGIALTAYAFDQMIPGFGTWFLPIAAFFFAFSTIISWGYYGETCAQYMFGDRAVLPFKFIYVSMILVGAAITRLQPVLDFSDAMLGLMLVPNLIGTFLLAPRVMRAAKDYFNRLDAGEFEEEARRIAEKKRNKS